MITQSVHQNSGGLRAAAGRGQLSAPTVPRRLFTHTHTHTHTHTQRDVVQSERGPDHLQRWSRPDLLGDGPHLIVDASHLHAHTSHGMQTCMSLKLGLCSGFKQVLNRTPLRHTANGRIAPQHLRNIVYFNHNVFCLRYSIIDIESIYCATLLTSSLNLI